ncbi:MAG: hypothetical protein AAF840_17760 [Bacteroidota bacterium]
MPRNYPAKVLVFGEHTVLRGGQGLAVPYPSRSLRWVKDRPDERLLKCCDYLKVVVPKKLLDSGSLEDWLLEDWRLAGDIPTGYGLGSSGAVCAAIWDKFATPAGQALQGEVLRNTLARMEQYFHGQSSGTDPLISYLNAPVLLGGGKSPQVITLPTKWNEGFFLVDTGKERQASHLIQQFTARYDTDPGFASTVDTGWTASANAAIKALLAGNRLQLHRCVAEVSAFQVSELPGFIPPGFHQYFGQAGFSLKLCGAGGGGMMLGLTDNKLAVREIFQRVYWL